MKSVLLSKLAIPFFAVALANGQTASNAIGSVSSSDAFSLNNVSISAKGVASWPLIDGDSIQTADKPVLLSLNNGSEVLVDPNSKIKIILNGKDIKIVVTSGGTEDGSKRRWCYFDSAAKTSNHKCGDGDHDRDDRCCPGRDRD
jgi:hypothetical protein